MSSIVPKTIITTQVAVKMIIECMSLRLGQSATFQASLYDVQNVYITSENILLQGETYNAWGNDDQYVIDYCAQVLDVQLETVMVEMM